MASWLAALVCLMCAMVTGSQAAAIDHRSWIVKRQTIDDNLDNIDSFQPASIGKDVASAAPAITSMEIVSDIRLRYAITRVTSRVSNPAPVARQTTFHIILPETAFISGFLMEVDGKVYKAGLKEKEKAQAEYQAAVDSGHSAAQVSARDSNEFTVSVNLAASSKIAFNLTYEELLSRRRSTYEQAIHINPGSVVPRMSLEVNIAEVLPVRNVKVIPQRSNDVSDVDDSHDDGLVKVVRTDDTHVSVIYRPSRDDQSKKSKQGLQGQFVVQYDVDRSTVEKKGGEVHVVDGYFVHFFAPASLPVLPKHIVFVLDTSGSMMGAKMEQTKQAMESILDQLRPDDVFSVVEFSSEVKVWDLTRNYQPPEEPFYAYAYETTAAPSTTEETVLEPFGEFDDIQAYRVNERSLKRTKEFVAKMNPQGGTNINEAMITALKNAQSLQSRVRLTPLIMFLTDGEPTVGETRLDEILRNTRKANSDNAASVYTLAFGSGADYEFLTKVATQNRGFSRRIYEAADATLQLRGFFDEVASPLLTNVHFVYDNNANVSDLTETKVANFFKGSETVIAGRVGSESANFQIVIDGVSANGTYKTIEHFPIDVDPILAAPPTESEAPKNATGKFSLEKIWAYLTIQELLKRRQVRDDKKELESINEKALNLSLRYGFVTPLTSLVVVKPNEKETAADVRPASDSRFPQVAGIQALPPGLQGSYASVHARPAALAAPSNGLAFGTRPASHHSAFLAYADPGSAVAPDSFGSFGSSFGTTTNWAGLPLQEESTGYDGYNGEPEYSEDSSLPGASWPAKLIRQFEHNNTHVNYTSGNETLSLLWNDELPDEDYQPCSLDYSKLENAKGVCKSVWKCSSITEDILRASVIENETINPSNACVINHKYIGICCITPSPYATTESNVDGTTVESTTLEAEIADTTVNFDTDDEAVFVTVESSDFL